MSRSTSVPDTIRVSIRYRLIRFCDRSWIFSVAFSGYEAKDSPMNWTSAAEMFTGKGNLLARIASIEDLCEAQAEARMTFNYGYWTALKCNSEGLYQWGHLANNTANVTNELLDRALAVDRCYVINNSAMKLLSKDCNSLQGVLLSYTNNGGGKQTISSSHQKRVNHVRPGKPGQKAYPLLFKLNKV